ncbi:hypothetical protein QE152_g27759 [Popillia japonica]|uniref:CCHC-type domain-containing protein n=1 Tax=Popillia japonica TaxID=7064 RepID=A0AAW1JM17_POPJA
MTKSYEAIVTALETVEDIKLDFVKDRLLGEEEKRKKPTNVVNHKVQSAFLCFGCGKPGHKRYQCPGRRHIGNTQYNPGQPGTSRYQNSGEALDEDISEILSIIQDNQVRADTKTAVNVKKERIILD